jgi:hypothetical protein
MRCSSTSITQGLLHTELSRLCQRSVQVQIDLILTGGSGILRRQLEIDNSGKTLLGDIHRLYLEFEV